MKNKHIIEINSEKCIGCGLCRKDCPVNNIALENKKAKALGQDCIMCGHCAAVCPKAAVSISGFEEPPVEVEGPVRLDPDMLLGAVRTRRSIRQFADRPVPPEIIDKIIETGRLTPTGGNAQDVSYIVLTEDMDRIEKKAVSLFRRLRPLAGLANPLAKRMEIDDYFFFKNAPAAIVVLSKDKVNGALAASNMALMAEACGLGVLYSGFFAMAANRSRALRRALNLKRGEKAVTTLVLGYSGVKYHRTAQKEAADVRRM